MLMTRQGRSSRMYEWLVTGGGGAASNPMGSWLRVWARTAHGLEETWAVLVMA